MFDSATLTLVLALVIGVTSLGVLSYIYLSFTKNVSAVRKDYLDGLLGIPVALAKAAEQDNALTVRNADLNRQNRMFEEDLNKCREHNEILVSAMDKASSDAIAFTNMLDDLQRKLSKAVEEEIFLKTELQRQQQAVDNFKEANFALTAELEGVQTQLDESLNAKPVVIQAVSQSLVELKTSLEGVLAAMGTPATAYETGVYNGIVAVGNTLFDDAFTQVALIHKEAEMAKPLRDAKGKFLKKVAA